MNRWSQWKNSAILVASWRINGNCCRNVRIAKANLAFSKLNNIWILAWQKVGTTNEDSAVHLHSYLLNIKWYVYQPQWTVGPHHISTVYSNTYWAPNNYRHSAGDHTSGRHQVGCNGYRWCIIIPLIYWTSNGAHMNHGKPLVLTVYPPYILTRTEYLMTTVYIFTIYSNAYWAPNHYRHECLFSQPNNIGSHLLHTIRLTSVRRLRLRDTNCISEILHCIMMLLLTIVFHINLLIQTNIWTQTLVNTELLTLLFISGCMYTAVYVSMVLTTRGHQCLKDTV